MLDAASVWVSVQVRSRLVDMRTAYHEQLSALTHPIEGPMMSDKSPRKSMSMKSGKSLKEKRADKCQRRPKIDPFPTVEY